MDNRSYPTVVHMLEDAVKNQPDKEALVCQQDRLSYQQYYNCVCGFANELAELGVESQRIAIVMTNSVDICIAMFAAHMARAQIVPMNPMYTEHELRPMFEDADAVAVVYDSNNRECIEALAEELNITHRFFIDLDEGRRLTDWKDTSSSAPGEFPNAKDLATLQFTGGTTGRSKGANLSHHTVSRNVYQYTNMQQPGPDGERVLCVMPLFHCYAWSVCLYNMVNCAGTVVILPRYQPQEVLQTLVTEKISVFAGSPTLFTGLMSYEGFDKTDFSNLKWSNSGSAPLAAELLEKWERTTGTPIFEGYGQTESGPVISFNPSDRTRKPGSVGVALTETEIQIVDIDRGESILPQGEQGEIRIRGPQVMNGYRNRPEETAEALRDGWLYTGDIGYLDKDDYLFITARKKEMLLVSGFNVFPREIEEVLYQHPAVREAAVVGRQDDYRGELPIAYLVLDDASTVDSESLHKYCSEHLAKYKLPFEFQVLESLPKTVVGKVDKVTLNSMANT